MNKNTIEIDLKNWPAAPFDFPHKCFSLSVRIHAALAALEGPEPWGSSDPESIPRVLAYHQLRDLADEAYYLFKSGEGQKAPFVDALEAILGARKDVWLKDRFAVRGFDGAGRWTTQQMRFEDTLKDVDVAAVTKTFVDYAHKLETMGLYFLRMMQAVNAENLPEEIVIEIKPATTQWVPVMDPGD